MKKTLTIATRQSRLAVWQANYVAELLRAHYKTLEIKFLTLSTRGDEILDRSLSKIGGKGLFLKELQQALLNGQADLAVHSLKDVPAVEPADFVLAAFSTRAEPRDAFISRNGETFFHLPSGSRIGTSSLRRTMQLKALRSDLVYQDLRGNVDTRLTKLFDGDYDGIVLAAAGLQRLSLDDHITHYFSTTEVLPAVGQGVLAIECLASNTALRALLSPLSDIEVMPLVTAERSFNERLGGNCQIPLGVHAEFVCSGLDSSDDHIKLTGFISNLSGDWSLRLSQQEKRSEAARLGEVLADAFLKQGATEVLAHYGSQLNQDE